MKIHSKCGKSVSSVDIPSDTIIRAYIECPECLEKDGEDSSIANNNKMWIETMEKHFELFGPVSDGRWWKKFKQSVTKKLIS